MKYYEVAAKWWADNIRNTKDESCSSNYNELIKLFEKRLAEIIKDYVDKNGHMILENDKKTDNMFAKLTKRTGININSIPENISMIIRPYNVTIYTDTIGNYKTIYLEKT